jgi:DNA-binding transcriptional ArsR family regulator
MAMDVYEALADPTRRQIISMLAAGERSAGDLSSRFDMAGPSVSRHLKVLRESGLISYRQQATSRLYRLEPQPLDEVRQWMTAQLEAVHARFDRLGAHLDRMKERGD